MWVIGFEETRQETIIRSTEGKDVQSEGRFWIEPSTGRVLMRVFGVKTVSSTVIVDVSHQSEPLLGLLVPVEMRETFTRRHRRRTHRGHGDLRPVPPVSGEGRRDAGADQEMSSRLRAASASSARGASPGGGAGAAARDRAAARRRLRGRVRAPALRHRRRGALRTGSPGVREAAGTRPERAARLPLPGRRCMRRAALRSAAREARRRRIAGPQFRDVFEVDGHAGARPRRAADAAVPRRFAVGGEQLGRILDESARFNIGDIERNINTPMFALQFLEPANQPRFKFKRTQATPCRRRCRGAAATGARFGLGPKSGSSSSRRSRRARSSGPTR